MVMTGIAKLRRYVRLYGSFMRICLMREMESRGSFVAGALVVFCFPWFSLLLIGAIYSQVNSLGGWSFYEYLILVGTFQIIQSLTMTLFMRNMLQVSEYVRKGELDFFLLKPVNSQFMLTTRYVAFTELAQALPGTALVVIGVMNRPGGVELWRLPLYLFFIGVGLLICYSFWFITVIPTIFAVRLESHELFFGLVQVGSYHPNMFGKVVRVVLVYLLPLGIIAATPADALLDRLNWEAALWACAIAVGLLVASNRFWRFAQTRYYGASS